MINFTLRTLLRDTKYHVLENFLQLSENWVGNIIILSNSTQTYLHSFFRLVQLCKHGAPINSKPHSLVCTAIQHLLFKENWLSGQGICYLAPGNIEFNSNRSSALMVLQISWFQIIFQRRFSTHR